MEHDFRVDDFGKSMLYRKSATSTLDWYNQDRNREAWFSNLSPAIQTGLLERVVSHGAMDMLLHWKQSRSQWIHDPHVLTMVKENIIKRKNVRPIAILGLIHMGMQQGVEELLMLSGEHYREYLRKQNRKILNYRTERQAQEYQTYKKHQDIIALAKIHQLQPDAVNVYSLYKTCLPHSRSMLSSARCPPYILDYLPYHPEGYLTYGLIYQQYQATHAQNLLPAINDLSERMRNTLCSITQQHPQSVAEFTDALKAWLDHAILHDVHVKSHYAEEYQRLRELLPPDTSIDHILEMVHSIKTKSTQSMLELDDTWDLV